MNLVNFLDAAVWILFIFVLGVATGAMLHAGWDAIRYAIPVVWGFRV